MCNFRRASRCRLLDSIMILSRDEDEKCHTTVKNGFQYWILIGSLLQNESVFSLIVGTNLENELIVKSFALLWPIWYLFRSKPIDKSNSAETLSDFSHHLSVNVRYLHLVTLIRRYYSDFRSNPSGLPSSCRSVSLFKDFLLTGLVISGYKTVPKNRTFWTWFLEQNL